MNRCGSFHNQRPDCDQRKMEVNPNRDIERTLAEATNIINEILNQNSLKVLAMSLGLPALIFVALMEMTGL